MSLGYELLRCELGLRPLQDLPNLAISLLEDGDDSPGLRQLASYVGVPYDADGLAAVHRKILREICGDLPSARESSLLLLEELLDAIAQGLIDPFEGASRIIDDIYFPGGWHRLTEKYVGDSLGIERMYGDADAIRDLLVGHVSWEAHRSNVELVESAKADIKSEAIRLAAAKPWRLRGPSHGAA